MSTTFTTFRLKYLSNDGINLDLDRFHCENFLKIYTFRAAENRRANFERRVPLTGHIADRKHRITKTLLLST